MRSKQMNDFLQYWARIYEQNPKYPIDPEVLSSALKNYGLTPKEIKSASIESVFPIWEKYFQGNLNLSVYRDSRQSCFLQFQSKRDLGIQHIKLYLSYPADKMEYCVKKIFEFIASNHIENSSKVASRVRADSIILRIANYDDAIKVMNFINRDPELVMYAKPTNPFIMRKGKVGVTYDDNISYNATLALMLSQYFYRCRKNNSLSKVNHRDFRDFINAFSQNTFRNPNNLIAFQGLPEISSMISRFASIGDCLVNYEQVLKLISLQLDSNMNLERYRSFYVDAKDYSKNRQMAEYYNQLINNFHTKGNIATKEEIDLLNDYIEYARSKYQNDAMVIAYLKKYAEEGIIQAITRDKDFRARFEISMPPSKALLIMQGNIENYVSSNTTEVIEGQKKEANSFALSLLQEYIDLARAKYGDTKVSSYLVGYVESGLDYITKEQDFRVRFLQYLPPQRLLEITEGNISSYVQDYIRTKNQEDGIVDSPEALYDLFLNACIATYQKYGYNQLRKAIESGMETNYAYFTDGLAGYKSKMVNISKEDFSNFCCQLLNAHGTQLADSEDICDKCAETISQMASVKEDENTKKMAS